MDKSGDNVELEEKFQEDIAQILQILQMNGTIIVDTIVSDDRHYLKVDLDGEDFSSLIGHHGRTMESLRTVLMMMAPQREDGGRFGVLLDINNYHSKREDYVRNLAASAVDQVKLTMQPMELTPMNPAERRVVHMEIQNHEGIMTESIGEGKDRRVVIKLGTKEE